MIYLSLNINMLRPAAAGMFFSPLYTQSAGAVVLGQCMLDEETRESQIVCVGLH